MLGACWIDVVKDVGEELEKIKTEELEREELPKLPDGFSFDG